MKSLPASRVVEIRSDVIQPCPLGLTPPRRSPGDVGIQDSINYYLDQGLVLIHIGQETTHDGEGRPYQVTVALLGQE